MQVLHISLFLCGAPITCHGIKPILMQFIWKNWKHTKTHHIIEFLQEVPNRIPAWNNPAVSSVAIAKYDDTNELKEEQRNDLLYLVEISVIALSRTIFYLYRHIAILQFLGRGLCWWTVSPRGSLQAQ
jgi:hypothetical protein